MAKISVPKGVIKDVIIVGVGVLAIWFGLQLASGTENPFYVVASGSMIPVLEVYDVLLVQGHTPFEDIEVGEIILLGNPEAATQPGKCSNCGFGNKEGSKFCEECGTKL